MEAKEKNQETANHTHAVIYWNYKVKAWRKRNFDNKADATEFYNVRMDRALKNAPTLSSGWTSTVQACTPKMITL
jgi:hypothetical protein